MVCGIGVMGALLVGVGRLVPTPEPTVPPSTAPTATAGPSAGSNSPSPVPSTTPTPSASPVAVVDPSAILAAVGDLAPITEAGRTVGTVTLVSAVYRPRIQGIVPPSGSRWLRISVTFQATAPFVVDPTRWSAIDTSDRRYEWLGAAAPDPPLEGSSLAAGESRTGYLVIAVPTSVDTASVVLQDAAGRDMVVFVIQ